MELSDAQSCNLRDREQLVNGRPSDSIDVSTSRRLMQNIGAVL
jgi:hypothetical protein